MNNVIQLTDLTFSDDVLNSSQPVLVDFWAAWCGPCRMITPIIEELAQKYDDKIKVGKVDVDSNQQIAMQYNVRSIPTVLLFKNGQVVDEIIGAVPKKRFTSMVDKHLDD